MFTEPDESLNPKKKIFEAIKVGHFIPIQW